MDKLEVAKILEDISAMMEVKGENPFKIRAYQNGARALATTSEDLATLVREGRLTSIKGIGKGLSENIVALVTTGTLSLYDELRRELSPGLLELTRIQGLGPKKALILNKKLGIDSLPALQKACEEGKIAKLKGFGEATQENILKGIQFHSAHAQHFLLDDAQETAAFVLSAVQKFPGVETVTLCGSLRRHKEVVRDIDVLASVKPARGKAAEKVPAEDASRVMKQFVKLPGVTRVLGQGDTKSSVLFHDGMQIDLRVVTPAQFPFAQHYFTGSKEHNVVMRQRAIAKKLKLNEYGLFDKNGKPVACQNETELFHALGLQYIAPELREDRGEFEAAEKKTLPTLIETEDIRGVFHVHSTWSDGTVELEDMIAEAQRLGFEYVGISDHSKTAGYAGGLSIERVKEQGKVIESLRKKYKIHIFWGSECDILKDGSMDYPDEVLERYDFVIASVHSFFKMPEQEMTARIQKALRNRYVTILGHLSGRLLLRREPYALSLDTILKTAAQEGVAVEINGLADRLELDWREIPKAKKMGCHFSCNPDAHSKADLHGFTRAVGIARKGWLTRGDVINALPLPSMKTYLKKRR